MKSHQKHEGSSTSVFKTDAALQGAEDTQESHRTNQRSLEFAQKKRKWQHITGVLRRTEIKLFSLPPL